MSKLAGITEEMSAGVRATLFYSSGFEGGPVRSPSAAGLARARPGGREVTVESAFGVPGPGLRFFSLLMWLANLLNLAK